MSDEKELVIVRGSTPLLVITMPDDIETSDIASGVITISQKKAGVSIVRTLDEMKLEGKKYSFFLKQSETLQLDSTKSAAIQAKFCTIDDVVLVSYIQNIEILPVNNEKMFEQDNPSGDTYEATGESGIEIVPDLVNFTPDIDVEQITISTDDYTLLRNKPILNGVTINGSQTSDEFGIYNSEQVDALLEPIADKDTEQDTRISTLESVSDEHDTAIETIEGQIGNHTLARNVLADEYTNAQIDAKIAGAGDISALEERIDTQLGDYVVSRNVSANEYSNTEIDTKVNTVNTRIDNQIGSYTVGRNVLSGEYTNTEIDNKVQAVQGDVDALDSSVVKSVNTIAPVNGDVTLSKADIGLGNVTNDSQVKRSEMGTANGVATLDANGLVPSSQLPSYVDDVLEYPSASDFPAIGETGKIYIAIDTNLSYRWSGTRYTKIASDLALGETSSTAYAGDKGKAVRDDLNTHVADNSRHITSAERTTWNGKQDKLTAGPNITIDANNVISAAGGSGGGAVDSVNGKTGVVVLDADDVGALPDTTTASDLGAYVKPSSGIPKTDLASAVQSSLNKADTALQTAPVTSVNTKTGAVSLTASDLGAYTKPSTGIPKADLASSVQTSLGKADTALQSAPVTSVNSKTGAVSLSASDVGALPDSTTIPTKTSDLTNDSGFLTSTSAVTSFNGQHGAVTYTAPVTSVNGQTGAVTVSDTTYLLSMSGNVITLTPSSGTASSITLPVYSGGVTA